VLTFDFDKRTYLISDASNHDVLLASAWVSANESASRAARDVTRKETILYSLEPVHDAQGKGMKATITVHNTAFAAVPDYPKPANSAGSSVWLRTLKRS
jgi:hypothetical protein